MALRVVACALFALVDGLSHSFFYCQCVRRSQVRLIGLPITIFRFPLAELRSYSIIFVFFFALSRSRFRFPFQTIVDFSPFFLSLSRVCHLIFLKKLPVFV